MNKAIYDLIGINYNTNRTADHRIVETIQKLLNLPIGSTIADIGAGTGNYSNALAKLGYKVCAVEPSEEMRNQSVPDENVKWFSGTAESIPLADNSVNGVVSTLAIHHFSSIRNAADEVKRICPKGPAVIFTLDPRVSEAFWFCDYFPEIIKQEYLSFPPVEEVAETITGSNNWSWEIFKFLLPHDLKDLNMRSGWNRPEIYMAPNFRQNTSGFALAADEVVENGLEKLQKDLKSGNWDKQYGHFREKINFDAGFRFIRIEHNKS